MPSYACLTMVEVQVGTWVSMGHQSHPQEDPYRTDLECLQLPGAQALQLVWVAIHFMVRGHLTVQY